MAILPSALLGSIAHARAESGRPPDGKLAWARSCSRGERSPARWQARALLSIQSRQRAAETRKHVFTIERIVRADERQASVRSVCMRDASVRIEQPRQLDSCGQPLTELADHFTGPVVGRENLRDEVGCDRGVAATRQQGQ